MASRNKSDKHACELVKRRRGFVLSNGLVTTRDVMVCLECERRQDERRERADERRTTGR